MFSDIPERQDGERGVWKGGPRGRGYVYNSFTLFYSRKQHSKSSLLQLKNKSKKIENHYSWKKKSPKNRIVL